MIALPTNAGSIQRQEMRRAFYAGVESALRMQWEVGDEKVSEDEGMAILNAWFDEAHEFGEKIAAGKA